MLKILLKSTLKRSTLISYSRFSTSSSFDQELDQLFLRLDLTKTRAVDLMKDLEYMSEKQDLQESQVKRHVQKLGEVE